jgi:hypothetical protein
MWLVRAQVGGQGDVIEIQVRKGGGMTYPVCVRSPRGQPLHSSKPFWWCCPQIQAQEGLMRPARIKADGGLRIRLHVAEK